LLPRNRQLQARHYWPGWKSAMRNAPALDGVALRRREPEQQTLFKTNRYELPDKPFQA
jgi:hypothetical protein